MTVRYWLYPTLTTLTTRLSHGEPEFETLPDYPFYPASWLSHSEGCTWVQVVTFVFMVWTLNKGFLGFSGSYFAERSWKGFPQWWRFMILNIYMFKGRLVPTRRMNFRKISKGRGGGNFESKNLYYRFWTFKRGFLSMKLKKKNCEYDFPKMRGEGGQKPFRTFPKIIRFGDATRP